MTKLEKVVWEIEKQKQKIELTIVTLQINKNK
jgi:hypothetical protein